MNFDYAPASKRLENKVAIITGGASGIGEATARLFVAHGAKVIVADIQDELGQKLSEDLRPYAEYMHCDVTQECQVSALVDFAVHKHGSLDVMFNNAAVASMGITSVTTLDMADFDRTFDVNVRGVLLGVKHAARVMIPARKGCILCTASVASIVGSGSSHPYTISKHAVVGIVKSTAIELGQYGIRVNCISPFAVITPLLLGAVKKLKPEMAGNLELVSKSVEECSELKGLMLEVDDVARAALYLASDDGRYVSGHNLVVDGGFTISKPLKLFK